MTKSLTHQTLMLARPKIALAPAREKLPPLRHEKSICSPRPPLLFIGGRKSPANAHFFPPIPPSFRLRFSAPKTQPPKRFRILARDHGGSNG